MQRHRLLTLALAAAGLMACTAPALAQAGDAPRAQAGDSGRRMYDPVGRLLAQRSELKLTDEQATRLEAIRSQYLERNRGQVEQLRRDRQARAAFRARMDSTRTEVMAVLTPEQEKKLEAMRREGRKEWRDGKHGDRHVGRHGHGHDEDGGESD